RRMARHCKTNSGHHPSESLRLVTNAHGAHKESNEDSPAISDGTGSHTRCRSWHHAHRQFFDTVTGVALRRHRTLFEPRYRSVRTVARKPQATALGRSVSCSGG